jgi:triosephosphate isomerase
MAKRRKLVVGNWKMNGRLTSGLNLAKDLVDRATEQKPMAYDMVICPPATLLWPIGETVMGSPVLLGAQNCHTANHGAYTGEISAGMLADLGCRYVILGHSERRAMQGETSELVAQKVVAAQLAGLITIVCVGETLEQRASGTTELEIVKQVTDSLPEKGQASQLVLAYEPVWAIGSGEIPEIDDIRQVHKLIRRTLGAVGEIVPVIYGGSVAPDNAEPILNEPEVDGVLVGSASLNSDGFWAIGEKCR